MKPSMLVVVVAAVLAAGHPVEAAEVAVFSPKALNIEPRRAEVIGEVLAVEYAHVLGTEVLGPAATSHVVHPGLPLSTAAQVLGLNEYLELTVVALDTRLLISAWRRDRTGLEIWRQEVSALNLDDTIAVCRRLASALAFKTEVRDEFENGGAHPANPARPLGVRARGPFEAKVLGVKFAGAYAHSFSTVVALQPLISVGFDARLEFKSWFLEVGAGPMVSVGIMGRQGYGGLHAELGASYYLADGLVSPYVGAGLAPRLLTSNGMNFSLAPYAQAGAMLWRGSRFRIYADLRVAQNVVPVRTMDWFFPAPIESFPTEFALAIGVGF